MPILKFDAGSNSAKLGHYIYFDRAGGERTEAFYSSSEAEDIKIAEAHFAQDRTNFQQEGGRQFFQVYIGFRSDLLGDMTNIDGTPDYARIAEYGRTLAERSGIASRHQFYVAVHHERGHQPHAHLVINMTSYVDGKKFRFRARGKHNDRERMQDYNDALGLEHGIQPPSSRQRDPSRAPDGVMRATQKGAPPYSWKMDLQSRIAKAASSSRSEEEFFKGLRENGVSLRRRGADGYSYSFTDPSGSKRIARASSLGDEYKRPELLDRFKSHREASEHEDGLAIAARIRAQSDSFTTWGNEARERMAGALRLANSESDFIARLEKVGMHYRLEAGSASKIAYTDSTGFQRSDISITEIDPRYERVFIEERLADNASRRKLFGQISAAVRKATGEEDFKAILSKSGIVVQMDRDRYLYTIKADGKERTLTGEALSRHLRTDAVRNRLGENAVRAKAFSYLSAALREARTFEDYEEALREHGIEYVPSHDHHAAEIHFKDIDFEASRFGRLNPEKARETIEHRQQEKHLIGQLRVTTREAVDTQDYHRLLAERGITYSQDRVTRAGTLQHRGVSFKAASLGRWSPEHAETELAKRDAYNTLLGALKTAPDEDRYHDTYTKRGVLWQKDRDDGKTLQYRQLAFSPKDIGRLADPANYHENTAWLAASRGLGESLREASDEPDFYRLAAQRGLRIDPEGVHLREHTFSPSSFGTNDPTHVTRALTHRAIEDHLSAALDSSRSEPDYHAALASRGLAFTPRTADKEPSITFRDQTFPASSFGRLNPEYLERNLAHKDASDGLARSVLEAKDLPDYQKRIASQGIEFRPATEQRPALVGYRGQVFHASSFNRLDPSEASRALSQRRVYEHLSEALSKATNNEHYLALLKQRGISYDPNPVRPTVSYGEHTFHSTAFGFKSPEHYADNAARADVRAALRTALEKSPNEAVYADALHSLGIDYRPARGAEPSSVHYRGHSYATETLGRLRPDSFQENRAFRDLQINLTQTLKTTDSRPAYDAALADRGIRTIPASQDSPARVQFESYTFPASHLGRLDPSRAEEALIHRDTHALMTTELRSSSSQADYQDRLQRAGIAYRPGSTTDASTITYRNTTFPASSFSWSNPERYPEFQARQELYTTLSAIRRDSHDSGEYLQRIQAAGINYHPGEHAYFEHAGHIFRASTLGNVNPEHATFPAHQLSTPSAFSMASRASRSLSQVLTAEIAANSMQEIERDSAPVRRNRRRRTRSGRPELDGLEYERYTS